jgi:predicted Zn-dependent protease
MFFANSQEAEFEADRLGIKYMKAAGYDPKGMIEMLGILREQANKQPIREFSYWRTHPYLPERMAAANKEVSGSMEFKDYLNLTGEK